MRSMISGQSRNPVAAMLPVSDIIGEILGNAAADEILFLSSRNKRGPLLIRPGLVGMRPGLESGGDSSSRVPGPH